MAIRIKNISIKGMLFAIGVLAFCGGGYYVVTTYAAKTPPPEHLLSQIISIETGLLKEWQQRGALKNELAYNAEGKEVSLLQRMLSQDPTIYPERKVTGYYGDKTKEAVRKFQKEQGISITGNVDIQTRNKLNEIFLLHLCPEASTELGDLKMHTFSKEKSIPLAYVPPDLVDVSKQVRSVGVACVRSDIVPDLLRMIAAAKSDGVEFMITSGYRKPEIQKYLFDFWVRVEGPSAIHEVALPGMSEHQLGTTVDFTDASIQYAGVDNRFAKSKGGLWLTEHAHAYGFNMSFPKGKDAITGFTYEPWHWRYVGTTMATLLHERNITFNEYSSNKN